MMRAAFFLLMVFIAAPAVAQTQAEGEMRLYIQQLEDRIRQLTGENERLTHEVTQLRAQLGIPAAAADPGQTGAIQGGGALVQSLPPQDEIGALSVDPNDPRIAPDGAGGPVDLSTLAGGAGEIMMGADPSQVQQGGGSQAMLTPDAPAQTTALSGSSRDEYDLAYGYILTGDYGLAEQSFKAWLSAFPNDPQAADAEFWLGESYLQQGDYREAANSFLSVYKAAPDSAKGPDALLKLGVSLSALGEQAAACATLAELGKRYPRAADSVLSRVHAEQKKAGCAG